MSKAEPTRDLPIGPPRLRRARDMERELRPTDTGDSATATYRAAVGAPCRRCDVQPHWSVRVVPTSRRPWLVAGKNRKRGSSSPSASAARWSGTSPGGHIRVRGEEKGTAMRDWHDATRCRVHQDEVAGSALSILLGRERSDALSHVKCRTRSSPQIDSLSIVANRLLELAPHLEPPHGFEARLLERLGRSEPEHHRGSTRS